MGALLVITLIPVCAALWLSQTSQAAAARLPAEVSSLENFQRGFTWVADTIRPSVVFIEVEREVEKAAAAGDGENETPDLRDFFGPGLPFPMPRQRPQQPTPRIPVGQGSGVVVDPSGYIVTNNHVVAEAAKVTVHLGTGDAYPAEVVGRDELTDLAVIKIKPKQLLRAAELGDADDTQVGSWAIAVGYPFGGGRLGGAFDEPLHYEPTITVGVVSAVNRQIPSDREGHPFRGLLQTDAPINPGNSGGPLVNIRAQVIGVNQAIYTTAFTGGNIGVGFAIPINAKTKRVIETLKGGEKVVRGRLGLMVVPLTETLKRTYDTDHGVMVLDVEPNSAADRAGLKSEDIILEFQGKKVMAQDEFVNMVQATKPGTTVDLLALRGTKEMHFRAAVEALAEGEVERKATATEPEKLGLTVEALPEEAARKANLEGGVRVKSVDPVSDGARIGLMKGDIIFKINREAVTDVASYRQIVGELKQGDPIVLWISRGGRRQVLELSSLSE
jgi:serine protease Do